MLLFVVDVILDKDASGKPGSGVAGGNLVWLGSYSLCQNMSEAHYCLAPKITLELTGFVSILHFTIKRNGIGITSVSGDFQCLKLTLVH